MTSNLYERLHNIDTQIRELYRERESVQRQINLEGLHGFESGTYRDKGQPLTRNVVYIH